MAEKKPKTKVATKTQVPTSISPQKIQPFNYDAIGFKNSQIDVIKGKMKAFTDEWTDIIDPKYATKAPEKSGRDIWTQDYPGSGRSEGFFEPNKRNAIIGEVYNAKGPLTGKTGYSKSAASKYGTDLGKMQGDLSYGTRERFKKKK
jgi:hypothetical protein